MEHLSDEILVHIFSFLPVADRKRVGLVCRRWYEIIWNTTCLTKKNWVRLTNANIAELCCLDRDVSRIIVDDMQSLNSLSFWEAKGTKVIALELYLVHFASPILYEMLRLCPNLKYLTLCGQGKANRLRPSYKNFVMPSVDLSNLVHLRLLLTKEMKLNFIRKFTESMTKLIKFEIAFNRYYWKPLNSYLVSDVLTLIKKNSRTLTHIKFDQCFFMSPSVLHSYLDAVGPQLKGLYLRFSELSDTLLSFFPYSLASKFENLENLELSHDPISCEGYDMVNLHEGLKQLKRLCLRDTSIDDSALYGLCQFEHLRSLDLSECYSLTADGISKAFFENKLIHLSDLRLTNLGVITDDILKIVMPKLSNLTCLYLNNCGHISNAGVRAVVENCIFLRELSLQVCVNVSDLSYCNLNSLECLSTLNLCGCNEVTVCDLKLPKLVNIDLTEIVVSKESLLALISNCPNLEQIYVSQSPLATDINFIQSVVSKGCVYPTLVFGPRRILLEKSIFY